MNLSCCSASSASAWDFQRRAAVPIGTVYDPFVMRALEGFVYSHLLRQPLRRGRHTVRDLALPRAARTSRIIDPGIGIETPGLTYAEPCYARGARMAAARRAAPDAEPDGEALYLRLSTTPIDQAPFAEAAAARRGAAARGCRRRRLPPP